MKLRLVLWLLVVAFSACAIFAIDSLWKQRTLAGKTIRLHVVAHSDAEKDQAQKLRVRDAVLRTVCALTEDCSDSVQAKAAIGSHLDEIARAAQMVLDGENSGYGVRVRLGTEAFETRRYDTFTLPAGDYPSLRVEIGAAQGHNWWCVVFPSLCMAATSDAVRECAEVGGYDRTEVALVTGGEQTYTVRFKTLEWLQKLAAWFD